ncbi:MAG TPA: Rrf2 family transcriptional regulator [Chloroflexi bacterium]|nr:Rrf2 family transcriptional regulator [Chloroflexota bacterium]
MRITTKGEYGLRVMAELARDFGQGHTSLSEVARRQGLPLAYLEQIIALLRKAGLVKSKRGAKGGYALAQEPEAITMGEIMRALEVTIAPVECLSESVELECCEMSETCSTRVVWKRVHDGIAEILDSTTLADLA